ncbi:hypothetical protein M413DRAFT_444292 [Hebeloma cylindrosporum]|uniref:BTB domain-containing protein n=1 Tax=Hebeloma cylindrosporum TaxID=76867 RepID=A0A0C3CG73_HEBCY|nr:hypothetical protein M413DRAFT_444292 [Hebeloma cylindrosporum h7]
MKPDLFFAVAAAAEKYAVFGAMSLIMLQMHQMKKGYPLEILNHCDAYDYIDLANEVALSTLSYSLEKVAAVLTHPGLLAKWLKYYHRWLAIPKYIDKLVEPHTSCPRMMSWHYRFSKHVRDNPLYGLNPAVLTKDFACTRTTRYYSCPCVHECEVPFQTALKTQQDAFPRWSEITRTSSDSTAVEDVDTQLETDPGVSSLFNHASADLTFRSSDNILFKIHAKYLGATSAGLAPPPSTLMDRTHIELEEPSTVLEILFQFVHPPPESKRYLQPDIRSLEQDLFFAVAEAAEKYIVYGAMNLFMTRMRQLTQDYPVDILRHACKHGYRDLADIVAPNTLSYTLSVVAPKLTTILYHWVIYYDLWLDIYRDVDSHIWQSKSMECPRALMWQALFHHKFTENPRFIFSPLSLPELPACKVQGSGPCPCAEFSKLFSKVVAKGRSIPKFSSIAFPRSA